MIPTKRVLLVAALVALAGLAPASCAHLRPAPDASSLQGEGNGFAYWVELYPGMASVQIDLDVNDAQALQRYRDANQARAHRLLEEGGARELDVQVTFLRPVAPSVLREKAAQTSLEVRDYWMVGRSPEDHKISEPRLGPITPDVSNQEQVTLPNGQPGGSLAGVILLKGTLLASQESLGSWPDDPLVYMVDTTAVEARELVAARHAAPVAGTPISVTIPSPFWKFDW